MLQQASTRPPAQPTYILRGHTAAIHSVCFLRQNSRLLTGDADGWVVLWNVAIRRAAAVWRAHEGSILGLQAWGTNKIITHGRDTKLNVWQLDSTSEASLSKTLPVDDPTAPRTQPWLLHSLSVNTMNFCAFTMCPALTAYEPRPQSGDSSTRIHSPDSVYIAVPGIKHDHIDIFHLPSQMRLWTIAPPSQPVTSPLKKASPGMVMALALHTTASHLLLAAGYEAGTTHLFSLSHNPHTASPPYSASPPSNPKPIWQPFYTCTPHTQPILSLTLAPSLSCYFTSAADSIIARHPLPCPSLSPSPFLSYSLSSPVPVNPPQPTPPPFKTITTHHAGQQSLSLRSDARIFATAGWDGRIRVYSTKTMSELAVLKWHKEGCYCVCFAEVLHGAAVGGGRAGVSGVEMELNAGGRGGIEEERGGGEGQGETREEGGGDEVQGGQAEPNGQEQLLRRYGNKTTGRVTQSVSEKREMRAKHTHWLAAGSKDGKVSLWEIY